MTFSESMETREQILFIIKKLLLFLKMIIISMLLGFSLQGLK